MNNIFPEYIREKKPFNWLLLLVVVNLIATLAILYSFYFIDTSLEQDIIYNQYEILEIIAP